MNEYILMRKNEAICLMTFTDEGSVIKYKASGITHEKERIAPLKYRIDGRWLAKWWNERSVPISQGRIADMLKAKGLIKPGEYLFNNLGLSLNDYYWIRPADSCLRWEDVNLYENDFKENILVKMDDDCGYSSVESFHSFTPNSTLQGQLEKSWQIRRGKRVLIKGNPDQYSADSINEVFASMLHKKQGYDNYTEYKLLRIKNKPYEYGCCSECFTNQQQELVTAWDILNSDKKRNDENYYEAFIRLCGLNGMDTAQLRRDLEYQIMTDYIMSNRDRHMNNVAVLRDADSLQFTRMAPIYDTGKSMFVRRDINLGEIDNLAVNSFADHEKKLLKLVTDKSIVDCDKLPSADELYDLYSKDALVSEERKVAVCKGYAAKCKAFERWQNSQI